MDTTNPNGDSDDYLTALEDAIVELEDKVINLTEKLNFLLRLDKIICVYLISKDSHFETLLERFNKEINQEMKKDGSLSESSF